MAKFAPKDLFMNFFPMTVLLDAANSTVLVELERPTGLHIRGELMFAVHLIEVGVQIVPVAGANILVDWALSTVPGLAALPVLGDRGLVAWGQRGISLVTEGESNWQLPVAHRYLPPIPVAASQLSLYAAASADHASLRTLPLRLRMGFTTTPLDAAAYTEVAETWAW